MLRAWRRDCTSRAVTWPWRGGSDDGERDGQVLVHVTTTGTTALRAIDCQKKPRAVFPRLFRLKASFPDPNHPVAGVLATGQVGRMSG